MTILHQIICDVSALYITDMTTVAVTDKTGQTLRHEPVFRTGLNPSLICRCLPSEDYQTAVRRADEFLSEILVT